MTKSKYKNSSVRTKKRVKRHRRSMLGVSTVVVMLSVVIFTKSVTLRAENKEYKAQEAQLKSQIEQEKNRTEEITAFRSYIGTDDYVKAVAQERLGLVDPNEIIFRPAE